MNDHIILNVYANCRVTYKAGYVAKSTNLTENPVLFSITSHNIRFIPMVTALTFDQQVACLVFLYSVVLPYNLHCAHIILIYQGKLQYLGKQLQIKNEFSDRFHPGFLITNVCSYNIRMYVIWIHLAWFGATRTRNADFLMNV